MAIKILTKKQIKDIEKLTKLIFINGNDSNFKFCYEEERYKVTLTISFCEEEPGTISYYEWSSGGSGSYTGNELPIDGLGPLSKIIEKKDDNNVSKKMLSYLFKKESGLKFNIEGALEIVHPDNKMYSHKERIEEAKIIIKELTEELEEVQGFIKELQGEKNE